MESAQKKLIYTLLGHIRSLGLISNSAYTGAVGLVHSAMDFPDFFQYPVRLTEEMGGYEHTQGTQ